MTEVKTDEQHAKAWWDAWWAEDFSWDGLGALGSDGEPKHPWKGWVVDTGDGSIYEADKSRDGRTVRPATLQDYWREQESDLITGPDGARFTRVHLSPAWKDGTPTDKANWPDDALDSILAPKLLAGGETIIRRRDFDPRLLGPDRRAQFQGCVLLRAAVHPNDDASPLSARFELGAFLLDANFAGTTFWGNANFDRTIFCGNASFEGAAFWGEAGFSGTVFCGDAVFSSAAISGDALMRGTMVSGNTVFSNVVISGGAEFYDANFVGDASFDSTVFSGEADFRRAKFSEDAHFDESHFCGSAVFDRAIVSGEAFFMSAIFSDITVFHGATFSGAAQFWEATFASKVFCHNATFSGKADFGRVTFSEEVDFYSSIFYGNASFRSAKFSGDASFRSAIFSDDANFDSASFSGLANFQSGQNADGKTANFSKAAFKQTFNCETREFRGLVYFDDTKFHGPTEFGAAIFDKLVSFQRVVWPRAAKDWHRAFDQTLFKATAVFTGAGSKSLAAFDGAVLERGVTFDDPGAAESDRFFRSERRGAIKAAEADLKAWVQKQTEAQEENSGAVEDDGGTRIKSKPIIGSERRRQLAEFRNRRLAELERGCRTLKKAMEYASNKTREQLFYRYELIARRAQAATPLSEKIFSYLYDWFGNYGASIGRPFMAVTGLTLLFSGVYWGLDIGWVDVASHAVGLNPTANVDPALERALSFSASRIFPFGAFDDVSAGWLQSYETAHGSLAALGVRILASLQSTFALTLVFMVGLAVRRKFQIS